MKKSAIQIFLHPVNRFIQNETSGGIVLFISALLAMLVANSPWQEYYHHLWEYEFRIGFAGHEISKDLHHWINDGLMSVFFFVVGLELKREFIGGELSDTKTAILPLAAGLGGMVVPAAIYWFFNRGTDGITGWGIPMATDIAFALGILYLLGDRIPLSLKVFLTALAIADDVGAVLVIAFFYTSDISLMSLAGGSVFMAILMIANATGVRTPWFYGLIGIGGLWLAFLMSGVHATIAGILAALTIPATYKLNKEDFLIKLKLLSDDFRHEPRASNMLVSSGQLHVIERIQEHAKAATTPLQRLEHAMHPLVAFVVLPVFAFANSGITMSADLFAQIGSMVTVGTMLGLLLGKTIGIIGVTKAMVYLKIADLPKGSTWKQVYGVSLLASVGFTMSLFITELAFKNPAMILQAKLGIFAASMVGGILGYLLLRRTSKPTA